MAFMAFMAQRDLRNATNATCAKCQLAFFMLRHKSVNSLFMIEMLERLNKIWRMQEAYTDYPKAASDNAKTALNWAEKNGWKGCGTAVGKARANQLANREPISLETIERMAAFIRHKRNSTRKLGEGCGRLMWLAWGGDEGVNWAIKKIEQIKNED
jgi:hypothetical protein